MRESLKFKRAGFLTANSALFLIFMGTAVLQLQAPARESVVPYAPYLILGLQVGLSLMILGTLRCRLGRAYQAVLLLFFFLVVLFLFSLLSAFWSAHPELVFQRSLMVFVPLLLVALLTWSDPNPLGTFTMVARGIVIFVTALSAIGLLLLFFGSETWIDGRRIQSLSLGPITLAQSVLGIPPLLRISSLTGNPNTLAMWIMLSLPLTLYLLHTRKMRPFIGKAAFILQLLGLVFTFSRTGIAATLFALAAYLHWTAPSIASKLKRSILGLTLVGAIVGGVLTLQTELLRVERFSLDLNLRDLIWGSLMESIMERPILGIGFGTSYEAILEPRGIDFTGHSAHLQTLAEVGIIGYVLVLAIWLFVLGVALKRSRNTASKERRLTLVVIASILASLFIHQLFEGSLLRYGFHTLFWGYLLVMAVHPGVRGVR